MTDPIIQTGTMNSGDLSNAVGTNPRPPQETAPRSDAPKSEVTQTEAIQAAATQIVHPAGDTVEISVPAHVKLLSQQGLSADEIAFRLRIDIQIVNRYLDPNPL